MSAYNFSRSGSRPRRFPSIDSEERVGLSFMVVYLLDSLVTSNSRRRRTRSRFSSAIARVPTRQGSGEAQGRFGLTASLAGHADGLLLESRPDEALVRRVSVRDDASRICR